MLLARKICRAEEKNEEEIFQNGLQFLANEQQGTIPIYDKILTRDTFTPKTIKRFTSHENGTLYGSPSKSRDGSRNLKTYFWLEPIRVILELSVQCLVGSQLQTIEYFGGIKKFLKLKPLEFRP